MTSQLLRHHELSQQQFGVGEGVAFLESIDRQVVFDYGVEIEHPEDAGEQADKAVACGMFESGINILV